LQNFILLMLKFPIKGKTVYSLKQRLKINSDKREAGQTKTYRRKLFNLGHIVISKHSLLF